MENWKYDSTAVGERIRRRRTELGLTQAQLAEKINRAVKYCADIERGTCGMSIDTLKMCIRDRLKSMDMWDCRNRHPFSLSGGQMQRLTLMMAYLSDKPIVILDEPTAGQDAESLERCAALIREMREEKTVLIITHDPELIAGACDRCIGPVSYTHLTFSVLPVITICPGQL